MKRIFKISLIIFACCTLFVLLGEPFRAFFKLSETTEVRPVCAFPLIFGIAFGFPGTLGCAIGNYIADSISGYPIKIKFFGFLIQLAYGYLPVLLFNYLRRNDANKYRMDRVYKISQYMLISIADSFFCAFLVWTLIHFTYGSPLFGLGFWNTFFNQIIFFMIVGIPALCGFSVIRQIRENKKSDSELQILFSLNEKLILFLLFFSIIIAIMAAVAGYMIFSHDYLDDPMKLWSYVYFACGIALCACMIPCILFLYYMEKNVANPIERLSSTAKNFGKESDIHLEIQKILMKCSKYLYFTTEIGNLARSYKKMATELEAYVNNLATITAEKEKNATQLKIATAIQLGALPKPIEVPEIELHASMKPALEVGGDFYDFFKIDDDHLALVVADVSGKGVPAALFMMISKIILRKNLKSGLTPAEALTKTNQELCDNNPAEMFVTCLCGVLDLKTKVLTYSNAGHEKPALSKQGSPFVLANTASGFVLGGMPGIKYKDYQLQMQSGDIMFTYTDGIPEAMSPANEEFGNERMLNTLNKQTNSKLQELCEKMNEAISIFNGTAPQFDDITMLAFKII